MKSSWRFPLGICLAWGAAACEGPSDIETARSAAGHEAPPAKTERGEHGPSGYHIVTLASLGGTASSGNSINDLGWVTGTSNLAGDGVTHASLWLFGFPFDLGTLGGANSAVIWPAKNDRGLISGIAETADLDPFGENWSCSAFFPTITHHVCRGFVWDRGVMRKLPTLGGNNSFATGTNNRGQTAGWAENAVHDPTCNLPQVLQFRAVIWGPGRDQIQELPPLPGDSTSAATAINDRGQVVGISGDCANAVGGFSARHAVLWENGTVTDLGNLGGVAWNTPMAINEHGVVAGFANVPFDPPSKFHEHAFVWTRSQGMKDLGTLDGDVRSQALGINERGQVVGLSRGAAFRAVVWGEDGAIADLSTLVVSGSRDPLFAAGDIDDLGVITGQTLTATGTSSAFVALPIGRP
jgi:probable HAF family extracellular repeat protein